MVAISKIFIQQNIIERKKNTPTLSETFVIFKHRMKRLEFDLNRRMKICFRRLHPIANKGKLIVSIE